MLENTENPVVFWKRSVVVVWERSQILLQRLTWRQVESQQNNLDYDY